MELSIPLEDVGWREVINHEGGWRIGRRGRRLWSEFRQLCRRKSGSEVALGFLIWPPPTRASHWVGPNVIPIVIDFWAEHLRNAEEVFSRSPLVIVTNLEIKKALASGSLRDRLLYLPLSISSRNVCQSRPEKTIDLIQVGRRNRYLHQWALEYSEGRPGFEYVYSDTSGVWPRWYSTKRGALGSNKSRSTYLSLLRSARVSLVSSPGIDGGEERTGGFNPVTPRFYESAAAGCHLIGRYPETGADFIENGVPAVCINARSAEEFNFALDSALSSQDLVLSLDYFVHSHTTVEIARRLRRLISEKGFEFLDERDACHGSP